MWVNDGSRVLHEELKWECSFSDLSPLEIRDLAASLEEWALGLGCFFKDSASALRWLES